MTLPLIPPGHPIKIPMDRKRVEACVQERVDYSNLTRRHAVQRAHEQAREDQARNAAANLPWHGPPPYTREQVNNMFDREVAREREYLTVELLRWAPGEYRLHYKGSRDRARATGPFLTAQRAAEWFYKGGR